MKYHLFIDETGDPSLSSINADFPVFILLGCVFEEHAYQDTCAQLDVLKRDIFGSDGVILHSRDIRKCEGSFARLFDLEVKKEFYDRLNIIMRESQFTAISVAIKKQEFIEKYGKLADDPYQLSLSFLLERAVMETDQSRGSELEITIESRGRREDSTLQNRYNELLDRGTAHIVPNRFKQRFTKMGFKRKRDNDCGLQIADLCAYPIARHIINPQEPYPAFDIVKEKLRRSSRGDVNGYGLKVFP